MGIVVVLYEAGPHQLRSEYPPDVTRLEERTLQSKTHLRLTRPPRRVHPRTTLSAWEEGSRHEERRTPWEKSVWYGVDKVECGTWLDGTVDTCKTWYTN